MAVVTGLYNWHRSSNQHNRQSSSVDHTIGYVDGCGEYTHPRRAQSFSLEKVVSDNPTKVYSEDDLNWMRSSINYPGDHHLRPHEWAYICSSFKPSPQISSPKDFLSNISGVSIPTTVVRGVDRSLRKRMMNKIDIRKWSHPLSMNDVSLYGDAYVKSMHCGPHNKTQLLISR